MSEIIKEILLEFKDLPWKFINYPNGRQVIYLSKNSSYAKRYIVVGLKNTHINYYNNCGNRSMIIDKSEIKKYHKIETVMKNFI